MRTHKDNGYAAMSEKMVALAAEQKGFLGIESARNELGITVSYWESLEAIKNWKMHIEHTEARNKGRAIWYKNFKVRICKVERDYEFMK
ncbi:antibiotic biosynthesis monooxygenase family protein [Aureibaculum sp. 2210JD6-5]|uniref:antibiotic biosynthesis monooxygenase family protein n=1 Tax=Aureibaculum sp. 2210JD6-5 TaxID=3103957 RepID=UPI0039F1EB5A